MIAYWDCSVAAAGDMLLAAHIDAGANVAAILSGLSGLGLDDWGLELTEVRRGSFRGMLANVQVSPDAHPHRPWSEVRRLLEQARLPDRVRERALHTFTRLAQVEANLHGQRVEDVELHEVGAVDAIVDIVGVCLALEDLGIDRIVAPPLPLGQGTVAAAHGPLPLPAPATLELLTGWPTVASPWPGEWVTPTGAALVTTLATPGDWPAMTPRKTGYGAGQRDPDQVANLVRVVLGDAPVPPPGDRVVELTANLDDQSGELLAPVADHLRDAGALDVWFTPILMKKGRPAVSLHVLADPGTAHDLAEQILRHTSTLGVRRTDHTRAILERWTETVDTPFGPIRVKVGGRAGTAWHAAPELEDVAARARDAGVPVHEVHRVALAAWTRQTSD